MFLSHKVYTRGVEQCCCSVTELDATRRIFRMRNLFLPHFFKTCALFMDTLCPPPSTNWPSCVPSLMCLALEGFQEKSRSHKAFWVLDSNLTQHYFLHNSEQSKSQDQPSFKKLQVTERDGELGPFLYQSLWQLSWAQSWVPSILAAQGKRQMRQVLLREANTTSWMGALS